MLGYLLVPFLTLIGALATSDRSAFLGEGSLDALWVTLIAATVATVLDAILGIPLGLWLANTSSWWRHLVTAAVLLPLAVPPVVGGLVLVLWLGPSGWLGSLLDRIGLDPINTLGGTILAQMFVASPFVIIAARAAFADIDPGIGDSARSLGCGPGRTLWRVLLPAARRGIAAGLVLGWVRCLGEFGATAIVAYHPYTLPVLTYVRISEEGLPTALPAGALLAAVGALAAGTILYLDARRPRPPKDQTAGDAPTVATPLAWIRPAADQNGAFMRVRASARFGSFDLDVAFEAPVPAVAILGPSGAGKTLTLRSVAGLVQPDVGRIVVSGRTFLDTSCGLDMRPEERHLGYVPQRDTAFNFFDVEDNVGFALRQRAVDRSTRIDELIWAMSLEHVRHARPETLSGGERQRVVLARALAAGPSALLLDEPFSNLDTTVRRNLRALVRSVHDRTGLPLLLVTHDGEDALDLADYVVILDRGRVVQQGPVDAVFARPANRLVASLVGIPNAIVADRVEPAHNGLVRAVTGWGELLVAPSDHPGKAWEVAVPLDAVRRRPGGHDATILSVRPAPDGWSLKLRKTQAGEILEAVIPRSDFPGAPFRGGTCPVSIDPSRCHLMPQGCGQSGSPSAS